MFSWLERQIVVLNVVGSSSTGHPTQTLQVAQLAGFFIISTRPTVLSTIPNRLVHTNSCTTSHEADLYKGFVVSVQDPCTKREQHYPYNKSYPYTDKAENNDDSTFFSTTPPFLQNACTILLNYVNIWRAFLFGIIHIHIFAISKQYHLKLYSKNITIWKIKNLHSRGRHSTASPCSSSTVSSHWPH